MKTGCSGGTSAKSSGMGEWGNTMSAVRTWCWGLQFLRQLPRQGVREPAVARVRILATTANALVHTRVLRGSLRRVLPCAKRTVSLPCSRDRGGFGRK